LGGGGGCWVCEHLTASFAEAVEADCRFQYGKNKLAIQGLWSGWAKGELRLSGCHHRAGDRGRGGVSISSGEVMPQLHPRLCELLGEAALVLPRYSERKVTTPPLGLPF